MAGFIGSNFIFDTLKEHPQDRIYMKQGNSRSTGNLSTLAPVMDQPNFRFVKLDICDRPGVYTLFEEEKPDVIVNFAAESHVDRSIENPEVFLQTNIIGTSVLMDACRKYGISRYHQVSTDEVYGDLPLDRPDLFFHEDTPIHTSSPYSTSKASADLLVMAYHRTYGLPVTISRCSNNYGPYQFPEKLIPLMIANALADKPLPVYGEGLNVRDWLYVEDHCKAIDLILRNGTVGEVYNIGGHNEMKNIDIVKLICEYLGKPESLIEHVQDRKGHDMRYAIDPTKIHNELGWLPETMFKDALSNDNPRHLGNSCVFCNLQGNILTVCRYNFCPALLCQTNMLLQPCQILRCFFCFFCCLHIQCRKAGLKRLCHLRRSPNNFFIGWRRGQTHQDMLFFLFFFFQLSHPTSYCRS